MIACCPGSFDPITNGHVDIIERAASIFDLVLVTVFHNTSKEPLFSVQERIEMAEAALVDVPEVRVESFEGLLVKYAQERGVRVVIKGLRAVSDFEYEFQMAQMNKQFASQVETLFMMTRPQHSYLSSSIVKEVARFGGEVRDLVPPNVCSHLERRFTGA